MTPPALAKTFSPMAGATSVKRPTLSAAANAAREIRNFAGTASGQVPIAMYAVFSSHRPSASSGRRSRYFVKSAIAFSTSAVLLYARPGVPGMRQLSFGCRKMLLSMPALCR